MTAFVVRCLGALEVAIDDVTATFPTDKVRALCAYLALDPGRPHHRNVLATLLWPEMPQSTAQNNLRVTLHRLRGGLDKVQSGAGATLLISTRQTVEFNPAAMWVDVTSFQALLAGGADHTHESLHTCDNCLARLAQAVDLYRGELLTGLGLADSPVFEEWLLLRREMLHQQAMAALHSLVLAYEQRGDDTQARPYAQRLLALDPYREEAHRQLMRILARSGSYAEALAQFDACRRLLRDELDVAPDVETVALYEQIRTGTFPDRKPFPSNNAVISSSRSDVSIAQPHPVTQSPLHDWDETPEITKLYGRQTELTQLEHWLVQDRCRLIALLGIGGVGKTTLAAAAAKAMAAHFDRLIWRSLLNAPPLDEVLPGILQTLSGHSLTRLPASLDEQLALLLGYLRQQRCLLVLDNLESVLQADQPGHFLPGYTGYAQLLQWLSEHRHQSCLLLTSRERPRGLARREEDTPLVRTLPLAGLDAIAGQKMLTERGVLGPSADAIALVQRYSGNPLALKLVAQTVQEVFGGDIGAFLAVEAPIFDDIRTVLDQQFARLSPLEQEILLWLAVEREPVSAPILRANLIDPGSPRAFVETLRALQRRSLIGQSAQNTQNFVLQNVVTEYLTERLVEQICQEIRGDGVTTHYSFLNRFALLKATAKGYMRASQARLIVEPISAALLASLGRDGLVEKLKQIIVTLRGQATPVPGYAAGNLLNLLLYLGADMAGYDFSRLYIRQAYLQGALLPDVNFAGANLAHSVFTYVFGDILAVQFDRSGQLLVAGTAQGKLCLWQANDGQLRHEHQTLGASASLAGFSPNSRLLASGDTDGKVRLWDVEHGRLLHVLEGQPAIPWHVVISRDEQWVASGAVDGMIFLWKAQSGRLRQTFQAHDCSVPALAFSNDGRFLASGDIAGSVYLWRITDHENNGSQPKPIHTFHGHTREVHALHFDGSGALLATGSHDCTVRIWDVQSGQLRHTLRTHSEMIRAMCMSPDGYTLASGGQDTFVCLWDVRTGQLLHTLWDLPQRTAHLAFSMDGRTLATVGADADQTICLWDVATGERLDTLEVYANHIFALDFAPDGPLLASGGKDGIVRLWDMSNHGQLVRAWQAHTRWIYTLAFGPAPVDGQVLLASAGREPAIRLWDVRTGRPIRTLHGHTNDVESIQFSADGQLLVSASRDQTVRIWHVPSGEALHTLEPHPERVMACAISSHTTDFHWVASGGDQVIRLWAVQAHQRAELVGTLVGHTNGIKCVAFSPDGLFLASSSYDHRVILWNVARRQAAYSLPLLESSVHALAFDPQGGLLALGLNDHTVRLWDLQQRQFRAILHGHTNSIEAVDFSRDGRWLASGSRHEAIRLWDVATGACVQALHTPGPYAGMNITGVTGISAAQKAALKTLGAVEM